MKRILLRVCLPLLCCAAFCSADETNIIASRADAGRAALDENNKPYTMTGDVYPDAVAWYTKDEDDSGAGGPYDMSYAHIDGGGTPLLWDAAGQYGYVGAGKEWLAVGTNNQAGIFDAASVTIMTHIRLPSASDHAEYPIWVMTSRTNASEANNRFFGYYDRANNYLSMYMKSAGNEWIANTVAGTPPLEEFVTLAITIGDSGVSAYQNGTNITLNWTDTTDTNFGFNDLAADQTMQMGSRWYNGSWQYSTNLQIKEVAAFNRGLTGAEISNNWYIAP